MKGATNMSQERSHIPPKGTNITSPPITIQGDGTTIKIILPTFHDLNTDMRIELHGDGGASVYSSSKAASPVTNHSKITSIVLAGVYQQEGTLNFIPIAGQTPTVKIFFDHYRD